MQLTKQQIEDWSSTDLHSMNVATGVYYLAEDLCAMGLIPEEALALIDQIIGYEDDADDAQWELDEALEKVGLSLDFNEGGQWATLIIFDEEKLQDHLKSLKSNHETN